LQGTFLQFFSQLLQPLNILEIGTFTGYSAICLAQGLQANGILHTIDINEELYDIQRRYFDKAGLGTKIVSHVGNALDIIPTLPQTFDLIFIDADKQNYLNYYHLVLPKLRQGGYILADNVLWSGKVVEPKPDKDTEAIIAFNDAIANDPQVETLLLPLRDGILIARKK
jgi:caffeoyl-CoA O-methyltransferase